MFSSYSRPTARAEMHRVQAAVPINITILPFYLVYRALEWKELSGGVP